MLVATSSTTGVRANQPKKARKKEILGVAGSHKKTNIVPVDSPNGGYNNTTMVYGVTSMGVTV